MFEKFVSWFLATFLKTYNLDKIRPRPPSRDPEDSDGKFIDRFQERNSDPEFQKIDSKVCEAIARAKWETGK